MKVLLRWGLWLWLVLCIPAWAEIPVQPGACAPQVLSTTAVRALPEDEATRPAQGWEPVQLPDMWLQRWPGHDGSVWYRIDWVHGCLSSTGGTEPLALGIDGMGIAGEVFINEDLLWRDASLIEPLSRSWNMPRVFLLPASALREGVNHIWVRVVGLSALSSGLGGLRLGLADEVLPLHESNLWRQRTAYVVSAGMSAAVGCLFLVVWYLRRDERAYGWYAAMSLCWLVYLMGLLATEPWPLLDTLGMARANIAVFVLYVLCFCLFTFRFGQQKLPRTEKWLWMLAMLGVVAAVLAPRAVVNEVFLVVWLGFALILMATCLQFQWHAWCTRQLHHLLLALCWLFLLVVGVHDLVLALTGWNTHETWASVTGPVGTVFMALLLGSRMASDTRRIERFNHELEGAVASARTELSQALAREHAQALANAKLQERQEIAHDLHDGLGGSLVRSMALVELAPQPLSNARVLSLLKVLRDDLRQVIDHGSSAGAVVPETPVQWAAPLRHRFTRILDEVGVASQWHVARQWQGRPSALQCLGLTRIVEEALSNVIKHSRAAKVCVECSQPAPGQLLVCIEDDGVGFDVDAVQHAGLSVGMRSMTARAERMGGRLQVASDATGTRLTVVLVLLLC